jgi:hypothetical protein
MGCEWFSYAATGLTGRDGRRCMDGPEAHPYQTYATTWLRAAGEKRFGCRAIRSTMYFVHFDFSV